MREKKQSVQDAKRAIYDAVNKNKRKELTEYGGRALTRTVMVKCLVVSTDGYPVGEDGEEFSKGYPMYCWEKRRRSAEWLSRPINKKWWKPVPKKAVER